MLSKFEKIEFIDMISALNGVINKTSPEVQKDLTLFMNITVGQLLFEGQKIKMLPVLRKAFGSVIEPFIKDIKNDTFGLFYGVSFNLSLIKHLYDFLTILSIFIEKRSNRNW